MGDVSFRFIERTQGSAAAQAAADTLWQRVDAFEQRFDFGDDVFTGGLYGESATGASYEPTPEVMPDLREQRVYQFAGRVSVVTVVDGLPTIEHREFWPDPEVPSDERCYVHVYDWTQDV